ncbi:hypothetical protein D8B26_003413 [Coccidioides posadasii str. Silveira]|nr:hypothetical protein D8B26_003413 [Coccidioides posadasii str. Silveira]
MQLGPGTFQAWCAHQSLTSYSDVGANPAFRIGALALKRPRPTQISKNAIVGREGFVVDGRWTVDPTAPQEDDGNHNINSVLLPDHINPFRPTTTTSTSAVAPTEKAATMSAVTPEDTAGGVFEEMSQEFSETHKSAARRVSQSEEAGPMPFTMSSLAPESTTVHLAKDVPLEPKGSAPGGFPETPDVQSPAGDDQAFISPLPATDGIGNPIHLPPGQKVPHPSSLTDNTVNSGIKTDKAGYEGDASDPTMAAMATSRGFVGSQPVKVNPPTSGGSAFIQSAAPTSTTAALAANVPLEKSKASGTKDPHQPAPDVPEVVRRSLSDAHKDPEAACNEEAVMEKKEVEQELLRDVKRDESTGEPAPVIAAGSSAKAPASTAPLAKGEAGDVSPKTKERAEGSTAAPPQQQTTAPGPTKTTAPETTAPGSQQAQSQPTGTQAEQPPATQPGQTPKKKKNRLSGLFSKLKEKLK